MMAVTIQGVRLGSLEISKDDKGQRKITGSYELMSNQDVVLAKQNFNGYSDVKVAFSAETLKHLNNFVSGAKADVKGVLGLTEGDKND